MRSEQTHCVSTRYLCHAIHEVQYEHCRLRSRNQIDNMVCVIESVRSTVAMVPRFWRWIDTYTSCRHPHVRIEAHKVYNEYIQDKQHIHMNSTRWLTLTEYVKHLGREGFCKVEETEKGWFISVIHRDLEQV